MFKKKPTPQESLSTAEQPAKPAGKAPRNWLKTSIIANIALVAVIAVAGASLAILHQSDTNPSFCATCHIMQPNVTSYLESNNLDNVHNQAGVECKECHSDYDIPAEITSGVKFILGDYEVDANGLLTKRKYEDTVCTQCHISLEHVATKTANLERNPHDSHVGELACSTCHVSHGEQVDYCSQCHENGGQRMIGDDEPVSDEG